MSVKKITFTPDLPTSLDEQISKILNDNELSEDVKLKCYLAVLRKHLISKPTIPYDPQQNEIEQAIKNIPFAHQSHAKEVALNLLDKGIRWNKAEEIIIDGSPIPRTNISDILFSQISSKFSTDSPSGSKLIESYLTTPEKKNPFSVVKEEYPSSASKDDLWEISNESSEENGNVIDTRRRKSSSPEQRTPIKMRLRKKKPIITKWTSYR